MARHPWTKKESDRSFDVLGDRLIEATQRYLRSERRQRIQADIYTVAGTELTLAQVDALEAIAGIGEMRMHELAAKLGVDPSTATRTTAPLVDLGLLERSTDPTNRRYVILRCTDAGVTAARFFIEERRRVMRAALTPMDPARRILLADLLEEYIELMDRYRSTPD
jgi:DNA-binding MarR family transcriptional regulator